jgi:4-amino-4-deoxychorismate lyase
MLVNGKQGNLISIRDRALLYGDGVFRTLRALHGKAQHWSLHYQKLQYDCAALDIACPDRALLTAELRHLLAQHPDGAVKLIVTRGLVMSGQGTRGYAPPAQATSTHIWDISPLPDYPADRSTIGIKARLCQLRLSQQPRLAGIKHLNRLENVLAAAECNNAESNDTDIAEGLLMDADGNVIEGIRSNLFLISRGELVTPDLSRCGVAGVQRDRVMAWASQHSMTPQVRDVGLDEVLHADELFVVNSIIGVWPIRELDHQCWNNFPVVTKICRDLYEQDTR